jgi:hypothetical protein
MKKEIVQGIIVNFLFAILIIFFPVNQFVENFPLWLKITIGGAFFVLLLFYYGRKIYYWYNKVNVSGIQELENFGLQIENKNILSEEVTIKKNKNIYFPVVPTPKPNTIHLLFAYYVKKLLALGLHVNMFVFDDYCMRKDQNKKENIDSDVANFIHVLKKYIGKKHWYRLSIIKESSFVKSNRRSRSVLLSLLNKSSKLQLREIKQIQLHKPIKEEEAFSRYMKPLYNMSFLSLTSEKYGFTLSGADEKPLWDSYNKIFKTESYRLCNLYIPTIDGTEARDMDNISYSSDNSFILEKVKVNFSNIDNVPKNSNISLCLKILIFGDNKQVTYINSGNNVTNINNWDNLIQTMRDAIDAERIQIYNSICLCIHDLINIPTE